MDGHCFLTKIAGGGIHSLVIDDSGNLRVWGNNKNGQLGDGTTTDRLSPIKIKSGTRFTAVAAGSHSLAIDSDGNLWAWGDNKCGQLGDGTITNQTSPVQIKVFNNS